MRKIIIKSRFISLIFGAFVASLLIIGQASAQTLTYELDYMFSGVVGQDEPAGDPLITPWLTATFEESGSNLVTLTMTAGGLIGNETVGAWYFNFDDTLLLSDLTFTFDSGGVPSQNVVMCDRDDPCVANSYQANGDGDFDFYFNFPPPPGNQDKKFQANETVIYTITSNTGSLSVDAFDYTSWLGGQGSYNTAAFVQQTGTGGNDSAWIAPTVVPEPVSSTLFLVGAATLGFRRLRRNKRG